MSFKRKAWDKRNKVGKAKLKRKDRDDTVRLERKLEKERRKEAA